MHVVPTKGETCAPPLWKPHRYGPRGKTAGNRFYEGATKMSSVKPVESNTPRKYQLFIDGKWVDAESGKTFTTPNPSTGEDSPKLRGR